jgi:hypothetical protein
MRTNGELREQAENMLREASETIINLNFAVVRKQYEERSLLKLLDICADVPALKSTMIFNTENLYAEVNLLGHDKLRSAVQKGLTKMLIEHVYKPLLMTLEMEKGLSSTELIELCKKEKLNLNKFGKQAENLRVFTAD